MALLLLGLGSAGALPAAPPSATESLLDVYRQAEPEDPQISRWRANREATRESHSQTEARALLPTVGVNANVTGNFQDVQQEGASVTLPGSSFFLSGGYSLILTQPLFHYDRWVALDQADRKVRQSDMELEAAQQDLILRVAERYFGLLSALDNQAFVQARMNALDKQREQLRDRFRVGDIADIDVSEVEAGYDRSVADAVESQQRLQDAREALREVTGNDHDALLALAEEIPLVSPEPGDERPWVEQAMTRNPRVIAAGLAMEVAEEEIQRQSSGHLPTFDLVGGSSYLTTGGPFGEYQVHSGNVGLVMNVQLYEGGQTSSRTREAAHRHEEARALLKQEQRSVHRQTRDAFHGVTTSIGRIQSLRQALRSQQQSLRAIRAGVEVGSRTALDLVLAEQGWYRARSDYARARYDYLLNTLRLKRAVGLLASEDLARVDAWLQR